MRLYFYVFVQIFMFSSCALLFNKPTTNVDIYSKTPQKFVYKEDTLSTDLNGVRIQPVRAPKNLELKILTDSGSCSVKIRPTLSNYFLYDLLFFYGIPLAIIDLNTPKMFDYPQKILLTPENPEKKFSKLVNYNHQGEWYVNLSFPHINYYNFAPSANWRTVQEGFFGLSLGADYYYANHSFLNFTVGHTNDFPFPFPALVDYFGPYYGTRSFYSTISTNFKYYFLSIGAGLSTSYNMWYYHSYFGLPYLNANRDRNYMTFGMVFPAYLQLGKIFQLGVVYRPTFVQFGKTTANFRYDHVISIDFAWKFNIYRK